MKKNPANSKLIFLYLHIDMENFWTNFIIFYVIILSIVISYFAILFPIILNYRHSVEAQKRETVMLRVIHSVYRNQQIRYFEMIPTITGDRIFALKSTVESKDRTLDLENNIEEVLHKETSDNLESYYINNKFSKDEQVTIFASVNSKWSWFWYKFYCLYFL